MDLLDRVEELKKSKLPSHVAIIPDGNGRWAARQDMDRTEGHKKGAEISEELIEFVADHLPIGYLTFYTFSTENWTRPDREVVFLMRLLYQFLRTKEESLQENDIRFRYIGDLSPIPERTAQKVREVVEHTSSNDGLHLIMALNYGGRQEILRAASSLVEEARAGQLSAGEVTEEVFADHLYTASTPDPDLLIRTSGEQRISNFLLWQLAYAEFWSTGTLWPDFTLHEFLTAIQEYQERDRRFGTVEEGTSR